MNPPRVFLKRFAEHNRSCWAAAIFSLAGAFLAWLLIFALYTGAVLLIETLRTGDTNLQKTPPWYYPAGAIVVALIFLGALIDRWRKRYRPVVDRAIIGFHLAPEVLLLPARLTLAIWDHLHARVTLSRAERAEAWRLLLEIHEMKRADSARLAYEFPDLEQLGKLLLSLQLTEWIDLHRGEEDWFYRLRSDQEPLLKSLLLEDSPDPSN